MYCLFGSKSRYRHRDIMVSMQIFFEVDQVVWSRLDQLSKRQRRLIISAVNYHSLIQPGRELTYKIYMGADWQYPRLTDTSTLNGSLTKGEGLEPFMVFKAKSLSAPKTPFSSHYFDPQHQLVDWNERYILLTPDEATDTTVRAKSLSAKLPLRNQIYNYCEMNFPLAFDYIREFLRRYRENTGYKAIDAYVPASPEEQYASGTVHHPHPLVEPAQPDPSAPKAVIIAMHWLQAGGAERWAMETVRLAHEAGFVPIVITNNDSHQPWIVNKDLDKALVLNLTFPAQEGIGDFPLLRALFEQYDIRGVMIHHNQWMYDRIWWVKRFYPRTQVVDSLHILEYHDKGGYPHQSVSRDPYIDLHHVISPQLEKWLEGSHGIPANKVVMAPLVGLTAEQVGHFKGRADGPRFCVSFVGRMTRQKRPEAFLSVVDKLERNFPGRFRFIMHGSGDMDQEVGRIIERRGLGESVELRDISVPVLKTYGESDALLITSINEGITLTTIEAISEGVPVLSADVGSQSTLVPPQGLLPRGSQALVKQAVRSLNHMFENEKDRQNLWNAEMARLQAFSRLKSADSFFTGMLKEWAA